MADIARNSTDSSIRGRKVQNRYYSESGFQPAHCSGILLLEYTLKDTVTNLHLLLLKIQWSESARRISHLHQEITTGVVAGRLLSHSTRRKTTQV